VLKNTYLLNHNLLWRQFCPFGGSPPISSSDLPCCWASEFTCINQNVSLQHPLTPSWTTLLPELPARTKESMSSSASLLSPPSLRHLALHPTETADVLIAHHHSKTGGTQLSPNAHTWDRTILLFLHSLLRLHLSWLFLDSHVLSSSYPAHAHSLTSIWLSHSVQKLLSAIHITE